MHSAFAIVLEVPSGALADALGRRRVILAGAVLTVLSLLAFALAQSVAAFMVSVALLATGRALISGSLEAWYVDALRLLDPLAPLAQGLSRGTAAEGIAMAFGALVGGAVVAISGDYGAVALTAAAAALVYLAAVALLVHEVPRHHAGGDLRKTIGRRTVEILAVARAEAAASTVVRIVFVTGAAIGAALTAAELLWQPRLGELLDSGESGGFVFGALGAASMAVVALGASLSPRAARPGARQRLPGGARGHGRRGRATGGPPERVGLRRRLPARLLRARRLRADALPAAQRRRRLDGARDADLGGGAGHAERSAPGQRRRGRAGGLAGSGRGVGGGRLPAGRDRRGGRDPAAPRRARPGVGLAGLLAAEVERRPGSCRLYATRCERPGAGGRAGRPLDDPAVIEQVWNQFADLGPVHDPSGLALLLSMESESEPTTAIAGSAARADVSWSQRRNGTFLDLNVREQLRRSGLQRLSVRRTRRSKRRSKPVPVWMVKIRTLPLY